MNKSLAIALLALAAVGCGASSTAVDSGAAPPGLDASRPDTGEPLDASTPPDADMPPDASYDAGPRCASQAECGDPVENQVANVCSGGNCLPTPELVNLDFECFYDPSFSQAGNRPLVQITRLVWSRHTDGTPVTCADLKVRSGATQAERSKLDLDPQINQAYRGLMALAWTGSTQGQTLFRLFDDVPRASGYLLYSEAWYGPREANNPTGSRATTACTEGVDLTSVPAGFKLAVQFKP